MPDRGQAGNAGVAPAVAGAPFPMVMPPSVKAPDVVWHQPDFRPFTIRPFSDIDRTNLAVELGAEPARVNIDVND